MKRIADVQSRIADDIGGVIDEVLLDDRTYRRLTKKILRAQRRLRRAVSLAAWTLFIRDLDVLMNDRSSHALEVVARTFYEGGRRTGRRGRK